MTDTEAEALGKRLVACRHFRPLRGMLDIQGRTWDASLLWRWNNDVDVPDLRDPATLGCVLALVREAWRQDDMGASRYRERWCVEFTPQEAKNYAFNAATEAEALVVALEAAP